MFFYVFAINKTLYSFKTILTVKERLAKKPSETKKTENIAKCNQEPRTTKIFVNDVLFSTEKEGENWAEF
jgi:hypothetical protein